MTRYLSGMKVLELDENYTYSDEHEEYFSEFDCLMEHIEDNHENEPSEIFTVETMSVLRVQYWFPDVDYINWFVFDDRRFYYVYRLPTLNEIIEEMCERTFDSFLCDWDDFDTSIKKEDLKGIETLYEALKDYLINKDEGKLKEGLDAFQSKNEHLHFLYPDFKSQKIQHKFKFVESKKGDLKLEYLGGQPCQ